MVLIDTLRSITSFTAPIQSLFNKFVVGFIIFLIGLIISRLVGKLVTQILHEIELRSIVKKATRIDKPLDERVGKIVFYILALISAVIALDYAGLRSPVLYIVSGGITLIIVVTIILTLKDFTPNVIATFLIHKRKLFKVGDTITVASMQGKVKEIGLQSTALENGTDTVYIPNATILKKRITVKKS